MRVRRLGLFGVGSGATLSTLRLVFATSGSFGFVFACSVVDKGDYEFDGIGDDDDGDSGSGGTSGKGGSSGRGGAGGQGGSGAGNEGGSGAVGATSGSTGQGAEGGAPEGGSAGTGGSGMAASGGVGAEGGMGPGECGDGTPNSGEDCDDGNTDTETCTYGERSCTVCDSECKSVPGVVRYCGDGRLDTDDGETCDDRNDITEVCDYGTRSCMVCGSTCTLDVGQTYYCGDGRRDVQYGEECDKGRENSNEPNRCRPSCKNPTCGDRTRDEGEACDDGNREPGDGCTRDCHWEPRPSCKYFLDSSAGSLPDGNYPVDPDGQGGQPPFLAFCDMTTDGGGWMLTYKVNNNSSSYYWWQLVMPGSGNVFPANLAPPSDTFEGPALAVRAELFWATGVAEWRATQYQLGVAVVDVKTSYAGATGKGFRCFATGLGDCANIDQSCSVYPEGYVLYNSLTNWLPAGSAGYVCDVGYSSWSDSVDWSAIQSIPDAGSDSNDIRFVGDTSIGRMDTMTAFWVR